MSFRLFLDPESRISPPAIASDWQRSWAFPSERGARLWNAEWDAVLDDPGHVPTAFLTIGGNPIADRSFDIAARIAGSALADEVHAGMPCPYLEAGWAFEVLARYAYHRVSPVRNRSALEVAVATHLFGPEGGLRWSTEAVREYAPEQVPDAVALLLTSRRWKPVREIFE